MLKVGDKIYCNVYKSYSLTFDKGYEILYVRETPFNVKNWWYQSDICILDDLGYKCWFGQIGATEEWTNWFISEVEWLRDKNIDYILEGI